MTEKQNNKERIKEITDSIEKGIQELFQSDKFANYLKTMSRFHKYSVNNTMLIFMQKPDATLVAGFNTWRDQFERNVIKGEKGIKIIAPTPYKKRIEQEKRDPDTNMPVRDSDGNVIMEEKEIKIPMYKPVTVFDVSQTEGKPLPQLASELTGNVQDYELFMEALRRSCDVPIEIMPIHDGSDGYFSLDKQKITIREGMSEVQTVSAVVHEIAHSKLHNIRKDEETETPAKDRRTEEVEAESISYAVCAYYGIETGENSFGYIAGWSKGKELKELRSSLETINKTSSDFICDIDRHYVEIQKENGSKINAVSQAGLKQTMNDTDSIHYKMEQTYINNDIDAYAIYQLKDDDSTALLRFMDYEWLKKKSVEPNIENYNLVFSDALNAESNQVDTLERIFLEFNANRPISFTGHSLSVSDVIALKKADIISYYYVDRIGYVELNNFCSHLECSAESKTDENKKNSVRNKMQQYHGQKGRPLNKRTIEEVR